MPYAKNFFSANRAVFALAVFLLPLFYLNVKDSHDWGDDFAQYFIQARNLLEHRDQADNGLVFDRHTGEYALKAYPVGFPLILASGWLLFGNSLLVSSLTLSLFFFALGLAAFFYFRKYFPEAVSMLLALVIAYNPTMVGFKKEILSDVPFSFFLLAGVLLFGSKRTSIGHFMLTGIAWGFALSIRGIGAVLFLAAVMLLLQKSVLLLLHNQSKAGFFEELKKTAVVCASAFGFYLFLNAVLFPIPSGGILAFYADAVRDVDSWKWIVVNAEYYYSLFLNFFANAGGKFLWLSTVTKYLLLFLLLPGMIISWYRKMDFADWLFIVYFGVLLAYPYAGGGFRFMLPVLPFLLYYIFIALDTLLRIMRVKTAKPMIAFLCVVLLQYIPGVASQMKTMHNPEQGPQGNSAVEAFAYISRLPEGAIVVFIKPRALSYYSGKHAAYVARNIRPAELPGLFRRMNAHYFLLCHENDEVNDVLLEKFVEENKAGLTLTWQNDLFDLYSDVKNNAHE
jgi:hypothetical protein